MHDASMVSKRIILTNVGRRGYFKHKTVRADLYHRTLIQRLRSANALAVDQHAVEAIGVGGIDLPIGPGQFGVMARSHIVVKPDIVILAASDSDHRSLESQALALEATPAIDQPAPWRVLTVDVGSFHTRLMPGRRDNARWIDARGTLARHLNRSCRKARPREEAIGDGNAQRREQGPQRDIH